MATIKGIKAGQVTITASYTDGGVTKTAQVVLTVSRITQPGTVSAKTGVNYGSSTAFATASGFKEATVYYNVGTALDSSNYTTASGTSTTIPTASGRAAGTYTLYWYSPQTTNYNEKSGSVSVTINKIAATLPTTWTGDAVYFHNTASVTATGATGGTVYYASKDSTSSTWGSWTTTAPTRTSVGTTDVKCYVKGDSNHTDSAESSTITLTVYQATDARMTVNVPAAKTYNGSNSTISQGTKEGIGTYYIGYTKVASTTAGSNNATKDGDITWGSANSSVSVKDAYTYNVYYKFTSDTSHSNDVTYTYVGSFTISKATGSGTVTMDGWTYGDTAASPSASTTTNGAASYTYYNSSKTSLGATKPTSTSAAGTYYVKATFAATTNYNGYTTDYVSFTISKRAITIKGNAQTVTYGNSTSSTASNVSVSSGSLVSGQSITAATVTAKNGDTVYNTSTAAGASGYYMIPSAVTIKSGTTDVTTNYAITYATSGNGALTISQRAITIKGKAQTVTYGNSTSTAVSNVEITSGTLRSGDSIASVTIQAKNGDTVYSTSTAAGASGYYMIPSNAVINNSSSTAVTSNYSITYATTSNNGALTINKRTITITGKAQTITYGGSPTLSYTRTNYSTYVTISGGRSGDAPGGTLAIQNSSGTAITSYTVANSGSYVVPCNTTSIYNSSGTDVTSNYTVSYTTTASNGKLTINKRTVTVTVPAVKTTGALTYSASQQQLFTSGSCTTGGTMYYYKDLTTSTAPTTFSTSDGNWSTTAPTAATTALYGTNAGTYYLYSYCYVSDTNNNNDTTSDNVNKILSVSKAIDKKSLTITGKTQTVTYGNSPVSNVTTSNYSTYVTATGLISGQTVSGTLTANNGSANYNTNVAAGTTGYTLVPSGFAVYSGSTAVTSNYTITYTTRANNGALTINKRTITITGKAQTITYGGSPTLSYTRTNYSTYVTISGGRSGDAPGGTLAIQNSSGTAITSYTVANSGSYVVPCNTTSIYNSSGTDVTSNYTVSYTTTASNGKLTINKANGQISYTTSSSVSKYTSDSAAASSTAQGDRSVAIATASATSTTANTIGSALATGSTVGVTYAIDQTGWSVAADGKSITIPSGTAAGTYSVKVTATAAASNNYKAASSVKTISVTLTAVALTGLTLVIGANETSGVTSIAYDSSTNVYSRASYNNGQSKLVQSDSTTKYNNVSTSPVTLDNIVTITK